MHFRLILVPAGHETTGTCYVINESRQIVLYRRAKTIGKRRLGKGSEPERSVRGIRLCAPQNWLQIVGSRDVKQFISSIEVDHVRQWYRIALYLAVYVAKGEHYSGQAYQHMIPEGFSYWNRYCDVLNEKALIAPVRWRHIWPGDYAKINTEMEELSVSEEEEAIAASSSSADSA